MPLTTLDDAAIEGYIRTYSSFMSLELGLPAPFRVNVTRHTFAREDWHLRAFNGNTRIDNHIVEGRVLARYTVEHPTLGQTTADQARFDKLRWERIGAQAAWGKVLQQTAATASAGQPVEVTIDENYPINKSLSSPANGAFVFTGQGRVAKSAYRRFDEVGQRHFVQHRSVYDYTFDFQLLCTEQGANWVRRFTA